MTIDPWSQLAEWWNERQGDEGDYWHRMLIDRAVYDLLGDVAGLHLIEIACGNGYLSRQLARRGATVTAVDASLEMIAVAKSREQDEPLGVSYLVADAAHLEMIPESRFDVAICNMGFMNIKDGAQAIREIARIVRPAGQFILSLCHPCFNIPNGSAWSMEQMDLATTVGRKVYRYRKAFDATVTWKLDEERSVSTPSHHRPLSWYFSALYDAGFMVSAFEEPEPSEELARAMTRSAWHATWLEQIPMYCVLQARKVH